MLLYKDFIFDLMKNYISFDEDDKNIECVIESEESFEKFSQKLKEAGISFSIRSSNTKSLDETCLQSENDSYRLTEDYQSSYDEVHFHRLKNSLSGVPPPPVITYPRQTVEEILNILKNTQSMAENEQNNSPAINLLSTSRLFSQQKVEKILKFFKTLNVTKHANSQGCDEPNYDSQIIGKIQCEILEKLPNDCQSSEAIAGLEIENRCIFYDIGYNINDLSEKIVELYDKYRDRYVGCETSSFVTANSPSKYFGKKKEKRKIIGRSPARRAAFQKTRRKIFSSLSLQAASKDGIYGLEKRTILIDKPPKKKDDKQTRRALFLSPEERKNIKLDLVKQSPSRLKSIEMRRSLWMRRKLLKRNTPGKQTPKKYGTPSKHTPYKGGSLSSRQTPRKCGTSSKCTPRKYLSPRQSSAKKCSLSGGTGRSNSTLEDADHRDEINVKEKRRCPEDVSAVHDQSNISPVGEDDLRLDNPLELSDTQRRKLLWAVSASLKEAGIGSTHKNFRQCGRKLYKTCKSFWTSCSSNRNIKVGISERMLSLASEHVKNVVKEVQEQICVPSSVELWSQDSSSCDFFSNINGCHDDV